MTELAPLQDLQRLQSSIHAAAIRLRGLARGIRETGRGELGDLVRRADRAAQCLDQARRVLLGEREDAAAAKPRPVPGLSGSSDAFPLSAVLSFLAGAQATGVLRAYGADETYVLQFESGYVTYAQGDNPPPGLLLGELLVDRGAVQVADLRRVLDAGWAADETLGGLLLREGFLQPSDLEGALVVQIQSLGNRLFGQEHLRFRFYAGERVIERQDVRINVMGLLLENARLCDEARRAGEGCQGPDPLEFSAA